MFVISDENNSLGQHPRSQNISRTKTTVEFGSGYFGKQENTVIGRSHSLRRPQNRSADSRMHKSKVHWLCDNLHRPQIADYCRLWQSDRVELGDSDRRRNSSLVDSIKGIICRFGKQDRETSKTHQINCSKKSTMNIDYYAIMINININIKRIVLWIIITNS